MPSPSAVRLLAPLLLIGACRAVPAAHPLDGEWSATLLMDSPGEDQVAPASTRITGTIVFDHRIPAEDEGEGEPRTRALGRTGFDLSDFFGQPYAPDVSTTIFGPVQDDFFREVAGTLRGDSARLVIIPRMSHGGLSLRGRLSGDSIVGGWTQNAYGSGAHGRFILRRVPRSAVGDSIVREARRIDRQLRAAAAREERERRRRIGHLRLRALDLGSGRYVPVAFGLEGHESNPEGGTYAISFAAGDGGWGEIHDLEPGTYDVIVHEFHFRGSDVLVDPEDPAARVATVVIRSGQRVSQDVRLHLDALATPSRLPRSPGP
jgi:hypothetical protein